MDTAFEAGNIQYPANWLRITSAEQKQNIGIYEVIDIRPKDERFYQETGFTAIVDHTLKQVRREYTYQEKPLQLLKQQWLAQIDQTVSILLSQTDWYVIRQVDIGTPIPANISAYRLSVRNYHSNLEEQINNVTNHEQLISIVANITWPGGI